MKGYFLKAINRFLGINWDKIDDRDNRPLYKQYMDGRLADEYFRRMAVFLDHISSNLNTRYPTLISAAKVIGYDFKDTFNIVDSRVGIENYHIKAICKHYLEWAALFELGEDIALEFNDLYDPMIRILENGGGHISMHHGSLIGGDGFGMHDFYRGLSEKSPINVNDEGLFDDTCIAIKNAEEALQEYLEVGIVTKRCINCNGKMAVDHSFSWVHNEKVHTCKSHYVIRCETSDCYKLLIRKMNADYSIISKNLKGEEFEKEKRNRIKIYNEKLDCYYKSGTNCPMCGNANLRYMNKNSERKFYLICRNCGRSFGLEEIEGKLI